MEQQMKEMDLVFAIRMENERISVEERCEALVAPCEHFASGAWLRGVRGPMVLIVWGFIPPLTPLPNQVPKEARNHHAGKQSPRHGEACSRARHLLVIQLAVQVKLKASEADALMQMEFYKKRCEEMQREHKQALVKMMPGYAPPAQSSEDSACDGGEDAALYEAEIMRLGRLVVEAEQAAQAKKKELAEVRAQLQAAEAAATESANAAARLEQQNDKMREELAGLKTNLQCVTPLAQCDVLTPFAGTR
jgi:hypothetical protein